MSPSRLRAAFGAWLREARLRASLTQLQLSMKLRVAKTAITNYEKGRTAPSAVFLIQYCCVLDLDLRDFPTWAEKYEASKGDQK